MYFGMFIARWTSWWKRIKDTTGMTIHSRQHDMEFSGRRSSLTSPPSDDVTASQSDILYYYYIITVQPLKRVKRTDHMQSQLQLQIS